MIAKINYYYYKFITSTVDQQPLTDDELRILKIILAEHIDKLNENKLGFDLALPGELKITKKMVVDGLHLIGQTRISKILDKKQGNVNNSYLEVDSLVETRHMRHVHISPLW